MSDIVLTAPAIRTTPGDAFLSDLWVGVVLAALVLSCVGCLCSCFLYHTFRQWQERVHEERRTDSLEGGYDSASLPSYTVVGGLPSYEEAIEQLTLQGAAAADNIDAPVFSKLSVGDLLDIYKVDMKK